jgi:hypothetical protein
MLNLIESTLSLYMDFTSISWLSLLRRRDLAIGVEFGHKILA